MKKLVWGIPPCAMPAWLFFLMSMCIAYRYTLGGFYLARYSDSPVGAFEEVGLLYSIAKVRAQSAARAQVFQGPFFTCQAA